MAASTLMRWQLQVPVAHCWVSPHAPHQARARTTTPTTNAHARVIA